MIEIDPRAELLVDARATRRLTQLELDDVQVPPAATSERPTTELFLRVLGAEDGVVRVELWERGEFCGERRLSVANASTQLGARRVALAAAELARQLRRKRLVERERAERDRRRRALAAERAKNRTLNGPLALASTVRSAWLPEDDWLELGPGLALEVDLRRGSRLDLGAEWLFGALPDRDVRSSRLGVVFGPARRFVLSSRLDLDVGLELGVSALHFGSVHAVDGVEGQRETWTARAGLALRLQPRLARDVRLSLGPSAGVALRRVPIEIEPGRRLDLGGPWLGAELGIVITPGARR